jgi:hypothetical protein
MQLSREWSSQSNICLQENTIQYLNKSVENEVQFTVVNTN